MALSWFRDESNFETNNTHASQDLRGIPYNLQHRTIVIIIRNYILSLKIIHYCNITTRTIASLEMDNIGHNNWFISIQN